MNMPGPTQNTRANAGQLVSQSNPNRPA